MLQTNLDCYLKTLHVLMWEEEDLLGTLHLTVSNFSKKKNVSAVLWLLVSFDTVTFGIGKIYVILLGLICLGGTG